MFYNRNKLKRYSYTNSIVRPVLDWDVLVSGDVRVSDVTGHDVTRGGGI